MERLLNKKGNAYIWLIIFIFIFIGVSTLMIDYGNLYVKTKKIKYAMNRAVKAASLQIKNDDTLINGLNGSELAEGIFKIDDVKAKEIFKVVLSDNLALNNSTLEPKSNSLLYKKPIIRELEVINDTPTKYTSSNINQTYDVENPSVVAVLEFEVKGLFLKTDIKIDKLSSSQLTSIYD